MDTGTQVVSQPGTTDANGFAPRFIATYRATDDVKLNAQVSRGFRLGGINDPLNIPLCTPQDLVTFGGREAWDDETAWNYEVGAKTRWLGLSRTPAEIAAMTAIKRALDPQGLLGPGVLLPS